MRTHAVLALAAAVQAIPQGVTEAIAPSAPAPAGCSPSYSGNFQVTVVNATSTATKLQKRDPLVLTLAGGILKDALQRTGYIASNYQFQFDGPPQAGSIYTAGFSVCANGSLALGGSAIWYQCYSGGFYNLYDRHWAAQCSPIYINAIKSSTGAASQIPDGQAPKGSGSSGTSVSQVPDGQVSNNSSTPVAPSTPKAATPSTPPSSGQSANKTIASGPSLAPTPAVASPLRSSVPVPQTANGALRSRKGEVGAIIAGIAAAVAFL